MDRGTFTVDELCAVVGVAVSKRIVELMLRARSDRRPKCKPKPVVFYVPSGRHKGKRPSQLTALELQQTWSGYNGCGNTAVADELLKEIRRRERSTK
jgi:hypothetical protein